LFLFGSEKVLAVIARFVAASALLLALGACNGPKDATETNVYRGSCDAGLSFDVALDACVPNPEVSLTPCKSDDDCPSHNCSAHSVCLQHPRE
jgi:hypothetical protein